MRRPSDVLCLNDAERCFNAAERNKAFEGVAAGERGRAGWPKGMGFARGRSRRAIVSKRSARPAPAGRGSIWLCCCGGWQLNARR